MADCITVFAVELERCFIFSIVIVVAVMDQRCNNHKEADDNNGWDGEYSRR